MTKEQIDAALAEPVSARAQASSNRTVAETVAEALKVSVGVTSQELEQRLAAKLRRDERENAYKAEQEAARVAFRAKLEAQRAALEHRIEPKLLKALHAHRTPCALFLGPTGCGKTSAAHWITVGHSCNMVRARDLATAYRRHGLGEGYPPEIERARERTLLVIDDVGSEGTDVAVIQDILDHRYSRCWPTIVTSGLTDTGLQAHLGAPYYRRIVDQHVQRNDGTEFPVLVVDLHDGGAR